MNLKNSGSSGQKVLASIIIRLALSDYFGSNCGIFALDEPTNHLDINNSRSLAFYLKKLVEMKKNDKNFQLILISHNEEFLKELKELTADYLQV